MQLSLENEELKQAQADYIKALQDAGEADNDVVGYVYAINGKTNGGDVYTSNALFRKMWRKQLAANVTEAISKRDPAVAPSPPAPPPSVNDVQTFLVTAETGAKTGRAINASAGLATLDRDTSLYAEFGGRTAAGCTETIRPSKDLQKPSPEKGGGRYLAKSSGREPTSVQPRSSP